MNEKEVLVEVRHVKKYFPVNKGLFRHRQHGIVKAVDDIHFSIYKGEVLGLIGESGCGKSTLSRVLMGLIEKTDGEIVYDGTVLNQATMPEFRKKVQMIFQDPYSSLDPRMRVGRIIAEPLRIHTKLGRQEMREKTRDVISRVSMPEDCLRKYPHEFSGGQRQRIGIARALIMNPEFVICDEPVSALDVSVQAQILNLFKKMQKELNLTYLFISHDMSVVRHMSDRIAVMYLGRVVELAGKKELFDNTLHPYSQALMNSIPVPDPNLPVIRTTLTGELPSPLNPPPGCPFQTRCKQVMKQCRETCPALKEVEPEHFVACFLYD